MIKFTEIKLPPINLYNAPRIAPRGIQSEESMIFKQALDLMHNAFKPTYAREEEIPDKKVLVMMAGLPKVGKDDIANSLVNDIDGINVSTSLGVKCKVLELFGIPAPKDENKKDVIIDDIKLTYRELCILTAEGMRAVKGRDHWVKQTIPFLIRTPCKYVFLTGVGFQDELDAYVDGTPHDWVKILVKVYRNIPATKDSRQPYGLYFRNTINMTNNLDVETAACELLTRIRQIEKSEQGMNAI